MDFLRYAEYLGTKNYLLCLTDQAEAFSQSQLKPNAVMLQDQRQECKGLQRLTGKKTPQFTHTEKTVYLELQQACSMMLVVMQKYS